MSELKPCPFCGEDRATDGFVRDGLKIFCQNCGASTGAEYHGPNNDLMERAVAAWNRRAEQAEQRADDAVRIINQAPILSKYHTKRGFEVEHFIKDYNAWRDNCRASLDNRKDGK